MARISSLPDDEELITRLLAGDEHAFAWLVKAYYGKMLTLARAIVSDAIADEVVQEAWFSVLKALPAFEKRSSLKTWILRIVANEAKSRRRREVRKVAVEERDGRDALAWQANRFDSSGSWREPPIPWHDETPEGLLLSEELCTCMADALAALPPSQQAVLMLRDMEGLRMTEICNVLEISESNARVLLHRARARLMRAIERYQREGAC